jgi:hypothetical protein
VIFNIFPKRYCQSEGPRLNCSRSYEQRGSKPLSSAAGWVEAEIIFNLIFRRLEGRFPIERLIFWAGFEVKLGPKKAQGETGFRVYLGSS